MSRGLLGAVIALAACGYHLPGGTRVAIPESARSISLKLFRNLSREQGLEVRLHRAIQDEFRRRGPLKVVPDPEGDLVLSGRIRRYASVPAAFSATDEAVQYQGVMQVSLRLTERATGRVLYETKFLQEVQDFGAVRGVVVTSSPTFQQGTIDARDLVDLTNVQLNEVGREQALDRLLELVARDIYIQTMEGF